MSPLMTTESTRPSAVASSTRVTVWLAELASPMSATKAVWYGKMGPTPGLDMKLMTGERPVAASPTW